MKHKYDEKCVLIDIEARDVFSSGVPSMIKCAVGINHCGNRINKIDKSNTRTVLPECGSDEYCEHVMLCKRTGKIEKNERRNWKESEKV